MGKDALEAIQQVAIYPEFDEGKVPGLLRYIPQKERDSYDAEDFAGPDRSFPITSQSQLDAAAHLIGHAADPAAVKAKAKAIAKRKGFKLPDSWQDDDKSDDKQERAADATPEPMDDNHPPFTSTHSHSHSHLDQDHEYEHSHDNDNMHGHSHEEATQVEERLQVPEHPFLYAPITRIDNEKWEVEGVATSEAIDSYGTIFSYEASKKAFKNWIERTANVREMHDKKAVGKGIGVQFDDANKQVIVRSRVSKGARDTWTKIQEGILTGYSVGTGTNFKWGRIERNGKTYPYLTEYELAELSYVDNASNPDGHGLAICRVDGLNTEIVDVTEPEPEQPPAETPPTSQEQQPLERAGKTISAPSQKSTHAAIGHSLKGAKALMDMCAAGSGCENCAKASKAIDPDNDGDVDWLGLNDTDNDADDMSQERMQEILERSNTPIFQRHNAILARYAQFDINYEQLNQKLDEIKSLQEKLSQLDEVKAVLERMASASTLDEVRAEMSAVKDRVQKIEDTPMPGGPVQNGARNPYEKSNPYNPQAPAANARQIQRETLQRLQANGAFQSPDDQIAAAALMLEPMAGWE